MNKKRASIRDVAKAAGVSHATVSLILNGKMAGSEQTRERVLGAVRDLGYRPDANFRKAIAERHRLNKGEPQGRVLTKTLALFLPESIFEATQANDGYFSSVFVGACQGAAECGWNILLSPLTGATSSIPEIVSDRRVDGALFEGGLLPKDWLSTISAQLPSVTINFIEPSIEMLAVTPQWEAAGRHLIEYAIGKGHSNFAFFQHDAESVNLLHVNRGHDAALRAHGIELFHSQLSRPRAINQQNTELHADAFIDEWAACLPRPTAILTSDLYAALIAERLLQRGYSIPSDVSLLARGRRLVGDFPKITTYVYPVYQIGYTAAKSLIQSIESAHYLPIHMMLPGELEEAGTVADLSP